MFLKILAAIAGGIPLTLAITAAALLIGLVLGIPLALALRSPHVLLRAPVRAVVNLIRAVPTLVWIFVLYFGVSIGYFHFEPLQAAIVVLGASTACYLAEVYRSSFEAVPSGQYEASRSLGLSRFHELVYVIFPQVLRIAVPGISTFALTLIKDSSIPSVIGVNEITHRTTAAARSTGQGLVAYVAAGALYLGLSIILAFALRALDARLKKEGVR